MTVGDAVVRPDLFKKWMAGDGSYAVEVHCERQFGLPVDFYGYLVDADGNRIWRASYKSSAKKAEDYVHGMAKTYRWLADRRKAQSVESIAQIVYGGG